MLYIRVLIVGTFLNQHFKQTFYKMECFLVKVIEVHAIIPDIRNIEGLQDELI